MEILWNQESEISLTPCILYREGWDQDNKFFTYHYKAAFVNPATATPMDTNTKAPIIMPDLSLPARLIIIPRIQKISLQIMAPI